MKIIIEIPDEEVYAIGKETIKEKIKDYIKFLKIKNEFKQISSEIQEEFKDNYWIQVEKAREEAWKEYKKNLNQH